MACQSTSWPFTLRLCDAGVLYAAMRHAYHGPVCSWTYASVLDNDAVQCNLHSTNTSSLHGRNPGKRGKHNFTWHEHGRCGDTAPETELTVITASPDSLRITMATMAAGDSILCHT